MADLDVPICAYRLDGRGGGEKLDWDQIRPDGLRWTSKRLREIWYLRRRNWF
jgi:hypothetical protein